MLKDKIARVVEYVKQGTMPTDMAVDYLYSLIKSEDMASEPGCNFVPIKQVQEILLEYRGREMHSMNQVWDEVRKLGGG